jgi:hypothetical protein
LSTPPGISQTDAKPPLPMRAPTGADQLGKVPISSTGSDVAGAGACVAPSGAWHARPASNRR